MFGTADVPRFDREALIRALRADQAGQSTFPEFPWRRRGGLESFAMMSISLDARSLTTAVTERNTSRIIPRGTGVGKALCYAPK